MATKDLSGDPSGEPLQAQQTNVSYTYDNQRGWRRWRVLRPGLGMYHDIKRRLPYYWSDIVDAWTYRTCASTIRMYFVKYVQIRALELHSVLSQC